MAAHTAIVGVTKTLKTLLKEYMVDSASLPDFEITSRRPDTSPPATGVNVFLAHVADDPSFPDSGLPNASNAAHPPLPLKLHYLITAYGGSDTEEETAQSILGEAMLVLHEFPVIPESLMLRTLPTEPILDESLRGESGRISFTLLRFEDLTEIWPANAEAYRPSIAIEVTGVHIDSRLP